MNLKINPNPLKTVVFFPDLFLADFPNQVKREYPGILNIVIENIPPTILLLPEAEDGSDESFRAETKYARFYKVECFDFEKGEGKEKREGSWLADAVMTINPEDEEKDYRPNQDDCNFLERKSFPIYIPESVFKNLYPYISNECVPILLVVKYSQIYSTKDEDIYIFKSILASGMEENEVEVKERLELESLSQNIALEIFVFASVLQEVCEADQDKMVQESLFAQNFSLGLRDQKNQK